MLLTTCFSCQILTRYYTSLISLPPQSLSLSSLCPEMTTTTNLLRLSLLPPQTLSPPPSSLLSPSQSPITSDSILLDVTGMLCGACVLRVKSILTSDLRVDSAVVNMLTEIIVGSTLVPLDIDLQKIRSGKLEEIVDPVLYYHEQPAFVKEQIERPPISGSDIYRTKDGVELAEFDIKSLKQNEIKDLLNKLVKIPEKDNEGFLLKLKQRMDRVGLKVPTIEVRFQHLNVTAEAYVGSRALPTIQNSCANMLEGFLSYLRIIPTPKKPLPILQDVSGIIKPGRMVLLLGPPTSEKTTLLLALAGKLGSDLQICW